MAGLLGQTVDVLKLLPNGGPSVCNVAVTNVCNATCDFCSYAYDKQKVTDRRTIDADDFARALDILHRRGIRYITFSGGEPLLHPRLAEMIAATRARGLRPSLVTNGWLLPKKLDSLIDSGLKTLFVSIDAADAKTHEENRGLRGVCKRIRETNRRLGKAGVKSVASITISRLIEDFEALLGFVSSLGFETVTFSYPKTAALGTSSMVYTDDSSLIDFSPEELIAAFEEIGRLKDRYAILNPRHSLADMIRHLKREPERFACYGGYKYFYMDWKLDVYRCDSWAEKMGTIWDFAETPFIRDGCTACMSDCYRDSSVFFHFPVSLGDALAALRQGRPSAAARTLLTRNNGRSIGALVEGTGSVGKLARFG